LFQFVSFSFPFLKGIRGYVQISAIIISGHVPSRSSKVISTVGKVTLPDALIERSDSVGIFLPASQRCKTKYFLYIMSFRNEL